MMTHRILAINPGATSTKLAIFDDDNCLVREVFEHSFAAGLSLLDELPIRKKVVHDFLATHLGEDEKLDAVVGRGGLLAPIAAGTYEVDQAMLDDLRRGQRGEHASNLGAFLAHLVAEKQDVPAYIVDPVSVDEMDDVARISGLAGVERESLCHALNIRAVAHRFADDQNRRFDTLRLVVAHLGTGVSMAAIRDGRLVDVVNPRDEGPIGLDRPGALPNYGLLERCFDPDLSRAELEKLLLGDGGVFSYLHTRDLRQVLQRAEQDDHQAALLLQAMIYDTAKWIAAMASVLRGTLDAVLLTGGMARSDALVDQLTNRIQWIAPTFVYAGDGEDRALVEGALRVLRGQSKARRYADQI